MVMKRSNSTLLKSHKRVRTVTCMSVARECGSPYVVAKRPHSSKANSQINLNLSLGGNYHSSSGLNETLCDKGQKAKFRKFLESEYSDENLDFLEILQKLKNCKETKKENNVQSIYEEFIAVGSPREINLSDKIRSEIARKIPTSDIHVFDAAQESIHKLLNLDSYPRFVKTFESDPLVNVSITSKTSRKSQQIISFPKRPKFLKRRSIL